MITNYPAKLLGLLLVSTVLIAPLTACSKQSWYTGAQSAKTSQCMKGPASEYEDCMQQSSESYDEYEKNRRDLIEHPDVNTK